MNIKHAHSATIWLVIFFMGCTGKIHEDKYAGQRIETVLPEITNEVSVVTLMPRDFNQELLSNGKLIARKYVDIRFESSEIIAEIYVKNGDQVQKNQKLAELADFRLNNKAALEKDALNRARLELQDVLIGQGYGIEDSLDIPPSTMQLARTKSGYEQAVAQYELALYEKQNAVLTAPFDGVVANLFTKQFNIASTSDVFCTIIDPSSLEASFTVLESELSLIQTGDQVEVTPYALPGEKIEGRITEINPLVDQTGVVQVKATVKNTGKLLEGMNVRVSIQRPLKNQLVIPKEAVVLRSGKQVVFTLVNGKAFWNYIQTGAENATHYTIADGLKEKDIVITGGNINLAHEAPVVVIND